MGDQSCKITAVNKQKKNERGVQSHTGPSDRTQTFHKITDRKINPEGSRKLHVPPAHTLPKYSRRKLKGSAPAHPARERIQADKLNSPNR